MLTVAFVKSTMRRRLVHLWYNRFKEGREDVNANALFSRPSTSTTDENIEAVKKMILNNHRITVGEVADDGFITFRSGQAILGMF